MDSASLLGQIQQYDKNRKNSVDVLNDAMKQYGVPEIRSRVAGLRTTLSNTEGALNAVDPSVTGRTQGSLVTEAQRSRQVANERAPIADQYGQQTRALGNESANLSDQLQAAQLLAQNQVSDYDRGRTALSSQYDTALARELEQRRRTEADRAYQLQASEAARQAAGSGGYNFGGGSTATTPIKTTAAPTSQPDAQTQKAYGDVKNLLSKDAGRIQQEYEAIKKSAGFGNAYDKVKLSLIEQLYPAAKNFGGNTVSLQRTTSNSIPLNSRPSYSGLSVGVANPGSFR